MGLKDHPTPCDWLIPSSMVECTMRHFWRTVLNSTAKIRREHVPGDCFAPIIYSSLLSPTSAEVFNGLFTIQLVDLQKGYSQVNNQ